jgi:hypothetical protein
MSRTLKLIIAVGVVAFFAVMIRSSFEQSQYRYQVCVDFHGRSNCSTAQGRTEAEAVRSAKDEDCTLLSGNRDDLMACEDTMPSSVQRVSKGYQTPAGMR